MLILKKAFRLCNTWLYLACHVRSLPITPLFFCKTKGTFTLAPLPRDCGRRQRSKAEQLSLFFFQFLSHCLPSEWGICHEVCKWTWMLQWVLLAWFKIVLLTVTKKKKKKIVHVENAIAVFPNKPGSAAVAGFSLRAARTPRVLHLQACSMTEAS